jgi:hypothetical protein
VSSSCPTSFKGIFTPACRVAEPEPAGAKTFGRSWSWSRYTEVLAPAPAPGQT